MALSRFTTYRPKKIPLSRRLGSAITYRPTRQTPKRSITLDDAKPFGTPHSKRDVEKKSISHLDNIVAQQEKDDKLPTLEYPIVSTPNKIRRETVEFHFNCEKKKWTSPDLNIAKFDMVNGGKLIGEPILSCPEDCICQERCTCPLPQWITTRLNCDGSFIQQSHHGDSNEEFSFHMDGKHLISINPCGSADCVVCEGAEFFTDDVEVYNFDF